MPEQWGSIVVKGSQALFEQLNTDSVKACVLLEEVAGLDKGTLAHFDLSFDSINFDGTYIGLKYFCSDWLNISSLVYKKAKLFEYYARHCDEYGCWTFIALLTDGNKLGFQFDQGGEAMDDKNYCDALNAKFNKWKRCIPLQVKTHFPEFSEIEADECLY